MDGGLKQRLVGALVLVALAVIFIPILLDNQRDEAPLSSRIPQEPALGEVREIPLDLEQAHQQVVKEQQALVARAPADNAPAEAQTAMPEAAAGPASTAPAEAEPALDSPAVEAPSQTPSVDVKAQPAPAVEAKQPAAAQAQPEIPQSAEPAAGSGDAIGAFLRSAWVVQAGVFGSDTNAKALTAKLKAAGFKAFTRKTPEGMRVFIGPELDRGKALGLAPRVESITKVKPRVVPFDPLQH